MEKHEPIPVEKLPYEQFKLLGMDKQAVLSLPEPTMKALLSGNRTSLIQFNNLSINSVSEPVTINARLSMQKKGDSYELKMHPVNLTPKNNLDLSQKEIDFLQKDPLNILPKMIVGKDGKLVDSFVSLDKVTNEFVTVKKDRIKSPESINDIKLSETQKNDFSNGKPIQVGKDKFQLDVNSEQGISGNNLNKIKFKSGEYNSYNLLADAALIISGLGVLVLVEHLAKMAFKNITENRQAIHELLKKDLKPAIRKTVETIAEKAKNGIEMGNKEKNQLLVFNVNDTLKTERIESIKSEPTQEVKTEEKGKYIYEGKFIEHGYAPFRFKEQFKPDYFVKLETKDGERVFWGAELAKTISEMDAKVGDNLKISHEKNPIKSTTDIKTENVVVGEKPEKHKFWEVQKLDVENKLGYIPDNKLTNISESNINNQNLDMGNKQPQQITVSKEVSKVIQPEKNGETIKGSNDKLKSTPVIEKEENINTSKIDELKAHISTEQSKENKAVEKINIDEIKLSHPELRQNGETKSVIKKDETKQLSKASNAKEEVKNDAKEIVKIKSGFKR